MNRNIKLNLKRKVDFDQSRIILGLRTVNLKTTIKLTAYTYGLTVIHKTQKIREKLCTLRPKSNLKLRYFLL